MEVNDKDLRFIRGLKNKLTKEEKFYQVMRPNLSLNEYVVRGKSISHTDEHMTEHELTNLLQIIERNNLILNPKCIRGQAVGFEVNYLKRYSPGVEDTKLLLSFMERQLPTGQDFNKIAPYFMSKRNLELAHLAEIKIINNRDHYDY